MSRDNMIQNIKIDVGKLNQLTNMLRINKKDIEIINIYRDKSNKQTVLSAGPKMYTSGYYGKISIKDFK